MSATTKPPIATDASGAHSLHRLVGLLLATVTHFIQQILDALSSNRGPRRWIPSNPRRLIISKPIFVWWSLLVWVWALNVFFCQGQVGVHGCSETIRNGDFRSNLSALLPESWQRLPMGLHQFVVIGGDNGIPQSSDRGPENSLGLRSNGRRSSFLGVALASYGVGVLDTRNDNPAKESKNQSAQENSYSRFHAPWWLLVWYLVISFFAGAGARTYWHAGRYGVIFLPNVKVSDGSQPPLTFGLSLSESAGSRSLHRLVCA